MSAFFLTGTVSRITTGASSMVCLIGTGANEADAMTWYHKWLEEGYLDGTGTLTIENIGATPVFEQLVTENGLAPLDWAALVQSQSLPEGSEPDDFDAGYWLDCQQLVPADNLAADAEAFRRSLSDTDAADLNWSAEKNHLFVIKVTHETMELVVVARARNALMAAWSWRHHGWEKAVSRYRIIVEPCCQIVQMCA